MTSRFMSGTLALALTLTLAAPSALAAPSIDLQKDHSLRVALKAPASAVVVSNPKIADVTVVDSQTVFILGRGLGTSTITITDALGRSIWDGEVTVSLGKANVVTLYRGVKSSLHVCKETCTEQEAGSPLGEQATAGFVPVTAQASDVASTMVPK